MNATNRSLLIAVLACLAMGLFAKSPQFSGGKSWITIALLVATVALSVWGFWLGLRGARQQRTAWSWLAPGINAFLFITILAFLGLMLFALHDFMPR
ncbi:MAG: hypothetical protein KIS77_09025 [Saprospiraceae bacterium]|nr:hypothetical protein [Saprospiraceae bacterium]